MTRPIDTQDMQALWMGQKEGYKDAIEDMLEILSELKNDNIGRDGSHEYESACQDFKAAIMELKGGEQE